MSDRMSLRVIKQPTTNFLEAALPQLAPIESVSHPCPHCGCPVRYALGVSEGDALAMQQLLEAADRYLRKIGATADVLSEVLALCAIAKAKKRAGGDLGEVEK